MRTFPVRMLGETAQQYKVDIGLKEAIWLPKAEVVWRPMEGLMDLPHNLVELHGLEDLK